MNRARDGRGAERQVLDAMALESGPIFRPSNPGRRLDHLPQSLCPCGQLRGQFERADQRGGGAAV